MLNQPFPDKPTFLANSHQALLNYLIRAAHCEQDAQIIEIRLSDWLTDRPFCLSEEMSQRLLTGHQHTILPNQKKIAQLHQYETDYLYEEIFRNQTYAQFGIRFPDYGCVIDIGANIGLFSLFVKMQCKHPLIYAIEPIRSTFEILRMNAQLHTLGLIFQLGMADGDGEQLFTHYTNSTVFSGKHTDHQRDESKIRRIIQNMVTESLGENALPSDAEIERFTELFMTNRLDHTSEKVPVRRLSTFLQEQKIDGVDLLKIDAEGSELSILHTLSPENWEKINQIVIEVHMNHPTDLDDVVSLLKQHHFAVEIGVESLLNETQFYNVYAIKKTYQCPTPSTARDQLNAQLKQIQCGLHYYLSQTDRHLAMMFNTAHMPDPFKSDIDAFARFVHALNTEQITTTFIHNRFDTKIESMEYLE